MIMMTEIRGASNEKAKRELGWEPRYPSWRLGFSERTQVRHVGVRAARRAAAAHASRSPTGCSAASARPRTSCRRRCSGSTTRSRRASRSPRRARTWPPSPPGWRSTSCARPAPGARPTSASGCPSRSSPSDAAGRSRPARGDGRLAVARVPRAARDACRPSSGPSSCCTTCSTTTTSGSPRSSARARTTRASSPPAPAGTSRTDRPRFDASAEQRERARGPLLRGGAERATSRRSRRCSPRTSSCTATAADLPRRSSARPSAAGGSPRCSATGCGSAEKIGGVELRRVDVNGQPGAESCDADGRLIGVMALDIADGQDPGDPLDRQPGQARASRPGRGPKELLRRMRETR